MTTSLRGPAASTEADSAVTRQEYAPVRVFLPAVRRSLLKRARSIPIAFVAGATNDYRNLRLELGEDPAVLVVDRQDVRNALDAATVDEIHRALEAISTAGRGVFIVTGAGDQAFIAGADIRAIRERRRDDALAAINSQLMSAIERHEAVSIAAVNGYALGGGCELALACDLRIAADTAVFGLPETGLGIIPGAGGTQRLARIVGLGRAKEMILTGARWDALQAKQAGLVSEVVPRRDLLDAARRTARRILERGPLATRLAKAALDASGQLPLPVGLRYESALQGLTFESVDKREGTTAFLEKRRPRFTGE
jgi:enoyl-CoA hydratase